MDVYVVKNDKGKQRAVDADEHADGVTSWLDKLNPAQKEAVTWSSKGGLQILAGPGSGKTRVLTCRVAFLIQECKLNPEDLVIVTFTNKAANEMKHRLTTLLGDEVVSKITMMGTFHSVAVKFLRRYGKVVDIQNNFVIADQSDCQSILKPIVQEHNARYQSKAQEAGAVFSMEELKHKVVQDVISKSKAKGVSPVAYKLTAEMDAHPSPWKLAVADVYSDYEAALRSSNTLDFDDLLVFCLRLLQQLPSCVKNVSHVLVDEFQDTNSIQYSMLKMMALAGQSLTIVGDPDQSIYAWRSAEVENLELMLKDFGNTHQVLLEENYRSTSSILGVALAVVSQDKERIQKSLKTSHEAGPPVALRRFAAPQDEAQYIAYQIKNAIANSGNCLNYDDFAILLRYNALSRSIEASLQSSSIPCRMIGGHKFFDRAEVKDIISYLQLAENPSYNPAFARIVNVPKRGIGDKSIKEIQAASKEKGLSCYEIVRRAVKPKSLNDNPGNIKPAQRDKLKSFVAIVDHVRHLARKTTPVAELIDVIVTALGYTQHLERTHGPEYTDRLENINELKAFADQVATDLPSAVSGDITGNEVAQISDVIDLSGHDDGALEQPELEEDNPLRHFLASSMLATDTQTHESNDDKRVPKVTISTCHAAKGLEWPVVFVPAVETGVYPAFQKSNPAEVAEERRLLYVAMTRAQAILHLTHVERRMERGQTVDKLVTEFLRCLETDKCPGLATQTTAWTNSMRATLFAVLGRQAVPEDVISDIMSGLCAARPIPPSHAEVYSTDSSVPAPQYSATEERFTSGFPAIHPQMQYGKPNFLAGQWRLNSYAGDDVRRYANKLPNKGTNSFSSAFETSQNPVERAQPTGFTSALSVKTRTIRSAHQDSPMSTVQAPGFSSALSAQSASALPPSNGAFQARTVFSKAKPAYGQGLNKPFKPPSMASRTPDFGVQQISTVETRLTQQNQAVILNPVAPAPGKQGCSTYSIANDECFAFLRNMAKEDDQNDIAPAAPKRSPQEKGGPKRRSSTGVGSATHKRPRS